MCLIGGKKTNSLQGHRAECHGALFLSLICFFGKNAIIVVSQWEIRVGGVVCKLSCSMQGVRRECCLLVLN